MPSDPGACSAIIAKQLRAAKENPHDDSPLFQLLEYMPRHEVDHTKTDTFRERFNYSKQYKERLAEARDKGAEAVKDVIADPSFGNLHDVEAGVVVDMFLTPARREGACRDDRPVSPHAGAAAARTHGARAVWLRAQPRRRHKEAIEVLKGVIAEFGHVKRDQWHCLAASTRTNGRRRRRAAGACLRVGC